MLMEFENVDKEGAECGEIRKEDHTCRGLPPGIASSIYQTTIAPLLSSQGSRVVRTSAAMLLRHCFGH